MASNNASIYKLKNPLTFSNTTVSSGVSSGSLIVNGGIGIAKNVYLGSSRSGAPDTSNGNILSIPSLTFTDSSTAGSGTLTNWRNTSIAQTTLEATNASVTTTTASSLFIAGPVIAGTNQTITNNYSLLLGAGTIGISGSSSGVLALSVGSSFTSYNYIFPTSSGTSGQFLTSAGSGTAQTWTSATGSGSVVLANTPTLITPNIGAATGTSLSVTGQLTSTISTGTAPLVVSSTTVVNNLNASLLNGNTFAIPGAIGSTTPNTATFTTMSSGIVSLTGSSSGTITIQPQAAAGTYNYNLPITAGSSGQLLTSGGGGGSPMTWTATTGSGSVVLANTPTLITPVLGAATGTSLSLSTSVSSFTNGVIDIGNTNSSPNASATMYAPNMGNGTVNGILFGKASSAQQSIFIYHSHIADSSFGNSCKIAMSGAAESLTIGYNNVQASSDIYVTGVNSTISSTTTGGQILFGYRTPVTTGQFVPFQVYNNSTHQELLFHVNSRGTSSGSNSVNVNTVLNTSSITITTTTFPSINKNISSNSFHGLIYAANQGSVTSHFFCNSAGTEEISIGASSYKLNVNGSLKIGANLTSYTAGTSITWNASGGAGETDFWNYIGGGTGGFYFKNKDTSNVDIGYALIATSSVALQGSTSGYIQINPQAVAGSYNFNLPTTSGSSGQLLTSGGGSAAPMTWTSTTGTGNVVLAAGPTISGTLTTANISATYINTSSTNTSQFISTGSGSLVYPAYFLAPNATRPAIIIGTSDNDTDYCNISYDSGNDAIDLFVANGTNKVTVTRNNTASTSSTTGGLLVVGGLGISNTTDATSLTNGGSITTAGGLAVAKKAYIGDTLSVTGDITLRNSSTPINENTTRYTITLGLGDLTPISAANTTYYYPNLHIKGSGNNNGSSLFGGGGSLTHYAGDIIIQGGIMSDAGNNGTAVTSNNAGNVYIKGGVSYVPGSPSAQTTVTNNGSIYFEVGVNDGFSNDVTTTTEAMRIVPGGEITMAKNLTLNGSNSPIGTIIGSTTVSGTGANTKITTASTSFTTTTYTDLVSVTLDIGKYAISGFVQLQLTSGTAQLVSYKWIIGGTQLSANTQYIWHDTTFANGYGNQTMHTIFVEITTNSTVVKIQGAWVSSNITSITDQVQRISCVRLV